MEALDGLNPQQQRAVIAGPGPVLVLAGPGSGKTRVLTHRITYLIESKGVRPYNILAVTFTNKAAREMEARIQKLIGDQAHGLTLGTFHAICARLLRREAEHLPFKSNYSIFDVDDQIGLVKRALEDLNIDSKRNPPQALLSSVSSAKNDLILPDDYPVQNYRDELVKRVYQRYQELLISNNGLDFDDLLLWTASLLAENASVREKYAHRFEHVLVDEFQDTNLAQYRLLRHLASFHNNIYAVGDTDQSIYAWRGADYRNLLRFERDYLDTQIILLEQNYRSVQAILDVAMAVIDRNPYRTPKRLFTQRGAGDKIILHETYDDREEAAYVVDTIAALVARREARPGDFAVMYRTNAQSRLLEEAFLHSNLPYKLVGAQRFYGRREIKDVIAYLRLVANLDDEFSLLRILNVPPRGIGTKSVIALRAYAQKKADSIGAVLLEMGLGGNSLHQKGFSPRATQALTKFGIMLAGWRKLSHELSTLGLMDRILDESGYRVAIDDGTEEGRDRWENVMELRRLAAEYQDRGIEDFLENVALVSDQDTLETTSNVPTLLTLHAAKGLEFPIVFIVGLVDGVLPHIRSFEDPEGLQEERRLFYVGITRTMDRLYLVSPQNRSAFGYSEPVDESQFLRDIPVDLLQVDGRTLRPGYTGGRAGGFRPDLWESRGTPLKSTEPQYDPGMTVLHPVWGEGLVLNSQIQDDEEIVDVFFADIGLKRLAASLAKLELKR
jgi:DNA helicase-2/ATP-dependent DNA helicase PcrA